MFRTDFELHEIPADLREFFEEVEVACGTPWVRVVERGELAGRGTSPGQPAHLTPQGYLREGKSRCGDVVGGGTLGWQPGCACDAGDPVPCVVLDPFSGAGTVALVADRLGRDSIGIELNPSYCLMAAERIRRDAPLFSSVMLETPLVDTGSPSTLLGSGMTGRVS